MEFLLEIDKFLSDPFVQNVARIINSGFLNIAVIWLIITVLKIKRSG